LREELENRLKRRSRKQVLGVRERSNRPTVTDKGTEVSQNRPQAINIVGSKEVRQAVLEAPKVNQPGGFQA